MKALSIDEIIALDPNTKVYIAEKGAIVSCDSIRWGNIPRHLDVKNDADKGKIVRIYVKPLGVGPLDVKPIRIIDRGLGAPMGLDFNPSSFESPPAEWVDLWSYPNADPSVGNMAVFLSEEESMQWLET